MSKFQVHIAVNVTSFAVVEVEAANEIEANQIVADSIEKQGWGSPIALGLYLLGQFDGTNAERKRLAQPAAFDDLIIRSQMKEGKP